MLLGTLISTVTTSLWVEPYVLYKHGFKKKATSYFAKYWAYTLVTVFAGGVCWIICNSLPIDNVYLLFVTKAIVCAIIPNIIFLLAYFRTKPFKMLLNILKKKLFSRKVI